MKSKKILYILLALAVLGAAAYGLRGRFAKKEKGTGRVITATVGPMEDLVEATGSVAPLNRVEIKPPISGRIEKLLADEGDKVREGQILAWMSSSDRAAILDAARAKGADEVRHWEDAYKPTPIIAPMTGVVILRNVVVGQTLDQSVVIYAMSDSLIVVAQVDESDIGRIRPGMATRITLDAYPDNSTEGRVFDILYEGKNVSNVIQYGVKVRPLAVPPYYRSQMTANVSFIVGRKENAVLVPSVALRDSPDGSKQVLVPGPNGSPVLRTVKTGIESGDKVEITEGLAGGDKLILAQDKYIPQQAPQSSPLTMGGRPGGNQPAQQKPRK